MRNGPIELLISGQLKWWIFDFELNSSFKQGFHYFWNMRATFNWVRWWNWAITFLCLCDVTQWFMFRWMVGWAGVGVPWSATALSVSFVILVSLCDTLTLHSLSRSAFSLSLHMNGLCNWPVNLDQHQHTSTHNLNKMLDCPRNIVNI